MFRNYFFINIILILIVSFLGFRFYKAVMYKKDDPVNITVKKAEPGKIPAAGEEQGINKESLKVITDKDIFRPSRTSSLLAVNSRPLKNPPTLFGTIISGAEKKALLKEDAGKTAKMYRIKESVSGYLITDIQDDKVLLEAGGQTIEVKLRGKKASNAPQITPGASRPASGSPVQNPAHGVTRRRIRPNPQRPVQPETNVKTPAPQGQVPAPAPEPVPIPEPPDSGAESPDSIQQQ